MHRPSSIVTTAVLVGSISISACAGAAQSSRTPDVTAGQPSPTLASQPVVEASASPDDQPRDSIPLTIDLANATGDDVHVDIADQSGHLVDATSGTPGPDGASVAPYELQVENVGARTLRLTWSDIAGDNALALSIDETTTRFLLVQPELHGDLMPYDRILVLTFDQEIRAADVTGILQDGLDS